MIYIIYIHIIYIYIYYTIKTIRRDKIAMKRCELKPRLDQEASFPFFIIHFSFPIYEFTLPSPSNFILPILAVWFLRESQGPPRQR